MRKTAFYPRLAAQNIRRNKQFYFPFLLTCITTTALFYILCFLTFNQGMNMMYGGSILQSLLSLGCVVIALFSTVFLFYTNSFLMKRRQKELGLYNILGMGKGHIAGVLFFETLFSFLISLLLGLALGVLFSKLMLLLLCRLVSFGVPFGFALSTQGLIYSSALFSGIFLLILLSNLLRIRLSKPIELLQGSNVGEREPKTRWLLAALGLLSLSGGYWLAITTEDPIQAMALFLVAVLLVIIGTYLLFTASSIAILKGLKGRAGYYYKTRHFIPVSGMIYRMKQNAVGLANICILITMVLVMVSGTLCLYLGTEDVLFARFPREITLIVQNPTGNARQVLTEATGQAVAGSGLEMENIQDYLSLGLYCTRQGDAFTILNPNESDFIYTVFLSASEYEGLTGQSVSLAEGEALSLVNLYPLGERFSFLSKEYKIVRRLQDFPVTRQVSPATRDFCLFVVTDQAFAEILDDISERRDSPVWHLAFDIEGSPEQKLDCRQAVGAAVAKALDPEDENNPGSYDSLRMESREADRAEAYTFNGGFLFLGLFLGLVFLIATVLIIYYKQLSEGYEDKERFEIMQKVGLSRREIKQAIHSQILIVFFLPLAMAVIHIAFAFKMITKLLLLLNLSNTALFAYCTLGTIALFALIYGLVYILTARVYYKLVS